MTRRVAITGAGVVSAIGSDAETFWSACLAGRSTVAEIPARWDRYSEHHSRLWSPLANLDLAELGFARAASRVTGSF